MRPPPLHRQTVVITGASSGIGRETAIRFARAGAQVVGTARSAEGLRSLVHEIQSTGGRCIGVPGDVSDPAHLEAVATTAVKNFGGIDTWVNAAGVLEYGTFLDTPMDDVRRLMEVNFIGQLHGARAALPVMTGGCGVIVAVSSVESVCPLPLHSAYAASKAAVDAAMSALRRELIAEGSKVSVVTVRPAVIDTPIYDNAKNLEPTRPSAPRPHYDPGVAANAILDVATRPARMRYVGGAARAYTFAQAIVPRVMDAAIGRFGPGWMSTREPDPSGVGNLTVSTDDDRVRGGLVDGGRRHSLYDWLTRHRIARTLALGVVVVTAVRAATRTRKPARSGQALLSRNPSA